MSHLHSRNRMITSLVLTLGTAAITGCGGGGGSDEVTQAAVTSTTATTAAPGTLAPSISTSASAVATTIAETTDVATVDAITAVIDASTASVSNTPTTSAGSTTTVVAETSTLIAASASGNVSTATNAGASATTLLASAISTAVARLPVSTAVGRPAGNTGAGFYVSGGKLYDAKGKEFRIRGVNRVHWDSYGSPTGLPRSGANAERINLDFTQSTTSNWNIVSTQMLGNKIAPIPGNWGGTCSSDPAALTAIVNTWVAQASTWTQLNAKGLINIANEWGPPNSTVWRDSYITAIARMRAAGYTGTLVVDSGGCGQDPSDLVQYGAEVLASDPQKNILFDLHVYGGFYLPATASWQVDYAKSMSSLKASGLPIIVGEFGPGKNIGPSPTSITPQQVIATAESNGWGWLAWAWDDNDLAGCQSDDNWFSMTVNCGTYNTDADLTSFGKAIVPILKATAVKATIFN